MAFQSRLSAGGGLPSPKVQSLGELLELGRLCPPSCNCSLDLRRFDSIFNDFPSPGKHLSPWLPWVGYGSRKYDSTLLSYLGGKSQHTSNRGEARKPLGWVVQGSIVWGMRRPGRDLSVLFLPVLPQVSRGAGHRGSSGEYRESSASPRPLPPSSTSSLPLPFCSHRSQARTVLTGEDARARLPSLCPPWPCALLALFLGRVLSCTALSACLVLGHGLVTSVLG